MKRKFLEVFLAALMACSVSAPAYVSAANVSVPIVAAETVPSLTFLSQEVTFAGTQDTRISVPDEALEAVKNLEGYTWGVRQLAPFNVLLRQQWITDTVEKAEYYQVNIHLNTTNMMGIFYYDLHEIGVVIFMLLWSCLFGALQTMHLNFKGPFSLMILGYVMAPVTLSFFAAWVDSFDLWMFCGTVLIFAVISCIHVKKERK